MVNYSASCILFAKIWKMFDSGRELSAHDIAESLEVKKITAWRWLACLHDMRVIHVVGYKKDTIGRDQTPIYVMGDGFDKPKHVRTKAERRAQYADKKYMLAEANK